MLVCLYLLDVGCSIVFSDCVFVFVRLFIAVFCCCVFVCVGVCWCACLFIVFASLGVIVCLMLADCVFVCSLTCLIVGLCFVLVYYIYSFTWLWWGFLFVCRYLFACRFFA